jgi:hypothetical protein
MLKILLEKIKLHLKSIKSNKRLKIFLKKFKISIMFKTKLQIINKILRSKMNEIIIFFLNKNKIFSLD